MRQFYSASALAFLTFTSSVLGQDCPTGYGRTVNWINCGTTDNPDFQCATLDVPLDYSAPSTGGTLKLPLVRQPARSDLADVLNKTIIYNPGGPGSSGIEGLLSGAGMEIQALVGYGYHVVSFDPRGIGLSKPFDGGVNNYDCPNSNSGGVVLLSQDDVQEAWNGFNAQGNLCDQSQYKSKGQLMGTAYVARDIVAIATALQEDGLLRYYGYSYGTLLGATLAAMFPQRIDRVVLDGNINPTNYYFGINPESMSDVDKAVEKFFVECVAAGKSLCALANDGENAKQLQNRFDRYLAELYISNTSAWSSARDSLFTVLYNPSDWPDYATKLVNSYAEAKVSRRQTASPFDPSTAGALAKAQPNALPAVACGDWQLPGTSSVDDFKSWLTIYNKTSVYAGDFAGSLTNQYTCGQWPIKAKERFPGPFRGISTRRPILFVQTMYDPITPMASALNSSAGFIGSGVLRSSGTGHCSSSHKSTALNKAIGDYFTSGIIPDTSKVFSPDVLAFQVKNPPKTGDAKSPPSKRGWTHPSEMKVKSLEFSSRMAGEILRRETQDLPVGCKKVDSTTTSTTIVSSTSSTTSTSTTTSTTTTPSTTTTTPSTTTTTPSTTTTTSSATSSTTTSSTTTPSTVATATVSTSATSSSSLSSLTTSSISSVSFSITTSISANIVTPTPFTPTIISTSSLTTSTSSTTTSSSLTVISPTIVSPTIVLPTIVSPTTISTYSITPSTSPTTTPTISTTTSFRVITKSDTTITLSSSTVMITSGSFTFTFTELSNQPTTKTNTQSTNTFPTTSSTWTNSFSFSASSRSTTTPTTFTRPGDITTSLTFDSPSTVTTRSFTFTTSGSLTSISTSTWSQSRSFTIGAGTGLDKTITIKPSASSPDVINGSSQWLQWSTSARTTTSVPKDSNWSQWTSSTTTSNKDPSWSAWSPQLTDPITSVVTRFSTRVKTITSCPQYVRDCPYGSVVTKLIPYTTKVTIPTTTVVVTNIIDVCPTGLTTKAITVTATCNAGCTKRPLGCPTGYTTTTVWCSACATPSNVVVTRPSNAGDDGGSSNGGTDNNGLGSNNGFNGGASNGNANNNNNGSGNGNGWSNGDSSSNTGSNGNSNGGGSNDDVSDNFNGSTSPSGSGNNNNNNNNSGNSNANAFNDATWSTWPATVANTVDISSPLQPDATQASKPSVTGSPSISYSSDGDDDSDVTGSYNSDGSGRPVSPASALSSWSAWTSGNPTRSSPVATYTGGAQGRSVGFGYLVVFFVGYFIM